MSRQNKQAKKIRTRKAVTAMRKSGQKGHNTQQERENTTTLKRRNVKEKAKVVAKKKAK